MRIVYMGTPDFAVESLDAICQAGHEIAAVVTVPDRKTGRGQKVTYSPVKTYALEHQLPILQPEKLRDERFLSELQALKADIFVVVAFRMLPQCVWSMPPMGTFNLHASLLPQYRGAAPINWALINGEKKTGVTTFMLNEKIDEGGILLQEETQISENDTAESLHDRLAEMGRKLVVETLSGLANGTLTPKAQEPTEMIKSAPKIFKEDCVIDWTKEGKDIRNFVSGLSPYPAATLTFIDSKENKQNVKIYEVSFEKAPQQSIGMIESDQKKYLKIGVRDGWVNILSLQMSGKRKISIEEFLRGYNVSSWKLII